MLSVISEYRLSKDFELLAVKAVDEELLSTPSASLGDFYKKCFDQAEIDGVPKTQISKIVRTELNAIKRDKILKANPNATESECLINHSWYSKIAKECGVVEEYNLTNNSNQIPPTVLQNSSSNLNTEFIEEIRELRGACDLIMFALKNLKNDSGDPIEIKKLLTAKQYANFMEELKTNIMIIRTTFDEKTKVPQNTHNLFKACIAIEAGLNAACKSYMAQRVLLLNKNSTFITNKQTNKFRNNEEPNILALYTPKTRDEAIYQNYYGVQCKCGSWRVKVKVGGNSNVQCIDCDAMFKGKTVSFCNYCQTPLYDDIIKKIKKTGKCPECKTEVILPGSF